jgi:Skp family chaperone for outer membrane proteins
VIKNISAWCFSLSLLFFQTFAFSQGNIGVISYEAVLTSSNYAQQQYEALQAEPKYKILIEEIQQLKTELEGMKKEGETKSLTWSDDQKRSHLEKGQAKVVKYKQLGAQALNIKKNVDMILEKQLGPRIEEIVNAMIKEKKIGLLLKAQAVYYSSADFNITEEVIKRLNKSQ